jgi:hypothetical protein
MKFLLLAVLIGLVFAGGGARLRSLFSTTKRLKSDYKQGKAAVDDPVSVAKEIPRR